MNTLEVILPLRNPPAVLEQTVKSLVAQTDRDFSVLLSDNHSTQGTELIGEAEKRLGQAGLTVRRVRPPTELGRVEHWNWAHYESGAEWLKPLFAGDWLEAGYVSAVRTVAAACPECRYVYSPFVLHQGEAPPKVLANPWTGRFHRAAEMERMVLSYGMQFGPPSAAAYERAAFIGIGGYPTTLPICADSLMFCAMAARYGALGLAEPWCHFNIHGARFSTTLPQKRKATFQEKFTFYFMLANRAWADGVDFPWLGFARLLAREARAYWSR